MIDGEPTHPLGATRPARRSRALKRLAALAAVAALALGVAAVAPAAAYAEATVEDSAAVAVRSVISPAKIGLAEGRFDLISTGTQEPAATSVSPHEVTMVNTTNVAGPDVVQEFTYRIVLMGTATDYWVRGTVQLETSIWSDSGYALDVSCVMYRGDPDTDGEFATGGVPYVCDASDSGYLNGEQVADFRISDNVAAEVQGTVTTGVEVSLDSGAYFLNTTHAVPGSDTVAALSFTQWDAILRDGDDSIPAYTAQGRFVYRIVDGGAPTRYWVMGMAENYRGVEFDHTSTCEIYDHDPTPSASSPGPATPVSISPYECSMTDENIDGTRGDWMVHFTVDRHAMTVITDPFEQAAKIDEICTTDSTDCGLALASVTKVLGPGKQASDILNNTSSTETLEESITASRDITTTNSVGVAVEVKAKVMDLFSVEVTATYGYSIAQSTTYSNTKVLKIPPRTAGWFSLSPEMVRAVGDLILRDGDTYYLLSDVSYDFAQPSGFSVVTAEYQTLIGAEPDGGVQPSPAATTPPVTGAPVAKHATANAATLPATGTSADGVLGLLGLIALLAGIGLVIIRRSLRSNER